MFSSGDVSTGVTQLDGVTVIIKSNSDNLTLETDYSYVLALPLSVDGPSNNATLTAPTQYGAMYGLETLTQIVRNGSVPAKALGVVVSDRPQYRSVVDACGQSGLQTHLRHALSDGED